MERHINRVLEVQPPLNAKPFEAAKRTINRLHHITSIPSLLVETV